MNKAEKMAMPDAEWQRASDMDLIKQGADYEIKGVPKDVADRLIAEQKGELYPDLASYIRANKVIACPKDEINLEFAEKLEGKKGIFSFEYSPRFRKCYFIDTDGNIAEFAIDLSQITSLKETADKIGSREELYKLVATELQKLGFTEMNFNSAEALYMQSASDRYKSKIVNQQEQQKKEGFDF